MKKVGIISCLILLLFITSISAQGCDSSGWKGWGKIFENKTISITCTTCNYINFTLTSPNGNKILDNEEMVKSGSTFSYEFTGSDLSELGTNQLDGYSQLETPLGLCWDTTLTGREPSISAYIISIIFIIALFIGLILINLKFDANKREELYRKIVTEYFEFKNNKSNSNLGYAALYLIAYGILRIIFVLYYLIILIFVFIFNEMIQAFGINTLQTLMPQVILLSLVGLVLVGVICISIFLEIIRSLLKDVENIFRGIE